MTDYNELLKETTSRLFADICTNQALAAVETGEWPEHIWQMAETTGLCSALDPESEDEALLPWNTLAVLVQAAGEYAFPAPLAETLLAQVWLKRAALSLPEGPLSIAITSALYTPVLTKSSKGWSINGVLRRVPWGRHVKQIACLAKFEDEFRMVLLQGLQPTNLDHTLANESRDDFELNNVVLPEASIGSKIEDPERLLGEAGMFRSIQMVGAMHKALALSVQYSMERVQFGRPIGKFQAVKHMVAVMAGQTAAASAAVQAALTAYSNSAAEFELRAAKLRTSQAASQCISLAHQVHGSMGFTQEHSLHQYTRRLMAWRDEYGSETACAEWIGRQVHKIGGDALWAFVVTPSCESQVEITPDGAVA